MAGLSARFVTSGELECCSERLDRFWELIDRLGVGCGSVRVSWARGFEGLIALTGLETGLGKVEIRGDKSGDVDVRTWFSGSGVGGRLGGKRLGKTAEVGDSNSI